MKSYKQIWRFLQINHTVAKYGLDRLLVSQPWLSPLQVLIYLNPWNWRNRRYPRGKALRLALIELGPIFVKFGQMLSTRPDIIPADLLVELAILQDHVPAFPTQQAKNIIEKAFGRSIDALFASFSDEPLGAASIAQVHAASLPDGRDVVVKLLRPGIDKKVARDIALMKRLAQLITRHIPASRRFRPFAVVEEFERYLADELDLMYEAANASQLRRNFKDSSALYVPEILWAYTTENVLVMERVNGIAVSDIHQLKQNGYNIRKLAERGVEIFFTQVFRDSFFHADMHPGNIFVSYEHPHDPKYIAIDFGIMGRLEERDKRYLAENFHAFFQRDYYRVAKLHVESGWVPYTTRITDFEAAIRTVCEPIFERPLSEISGAQMLLRLFQVGRRFNMEVQPQLVLLQKTLFAVEGLGRRLYPDLDLWQTAKPFLEKWLANEITPSTLLKKLSTHAPYWLERLPEIPSIWLENLTYQRDEHLANRSPKPPPEQNRIGSQPFYLGVGVACVAVAVANIWLNASGWFDGVHLQWINSGLLSLGVISVFVGRRL